jgi:hypothetical protein
MAREAVVVFDAASHTYRLGTDHWPHVTQALDQAVNFSNIPAAHLEYASDRGRKGHKMIALHVRHTLDVATLDQVLRPYLAAFVRFCLDTKFTAISSELVVASYRYRYAGMLDLLGTMTGRRGLHHALIDLKFTAAISPLAGPQTAAYKQAAKETPIKFAGRLRRYALQLRPDATYRLQRFDDDAGDLSVFLSLLAIHAWRQAHQC